MPRTPVVAGNWKMHTTLAEALALAGAVRDGCRGLTEIRVAVCPPFTALAAVSEVLAGSPVLVGAQDAHWEAAGPFTGSVSPAQVWDAGARLVILGHSERRHGLGETDDVVRRKVTAALARGLMPLVCVGETAAEREAGQTLGRGHPPARGGARGARARGSRALLARVRARVGHRDGTDGHPRAGGRGPCAASRGAGPAGGPGGRRRLPDPLRGQRQARGHARAHVASPTSTARSWAGRASRPPTSSASSEPASRPRGGRARPPAEPPP